MALTPQQKRRIAATYAPILYFHPDERYGPIRPDSFIQSCALWQGPPTDEKERWGLNPPSVFPRTPIIPKGGLHLDPAFDSEGASDANGDGVQDWYIGHVTNGSQPHLISNADRESWLDSAGWAGAQDVTAGSDNRLCNKEGAVAAWRESPISFTRTFSDWYHVEVVEWDGLQRTLFALDEFNGQPPGDFLLKVLGNKLTLVVYYFLFPIHEEFLKRCEQVVDPTSSGDYEGDWNAVAIIINEDATFPWDGAAPPPTPLYMGFGLTLRGVADALVDSEMTRNTFRILPWNEVERMGTNSTHPRVFVTRGYHNNYSRFGDHDPPEIEFFSIPVEKLTCGALETFDKVKQDVTDAVDDVGDFFEDIGVAIAKVAAGAALGFQFGGPAGYLAGAAAGLVGGLVEALSSSGSDDHPDDAAWNALEREAGPDPENFGLVLKPSDVANPLSPTIEGRPGKQEQASQIRDWNGDESDRLVDRSRQIWWPTEDQRQGYDGRWGVRCTDDPNLRRSGIRFPAFKALFLNQLATHIARPAG
jgi:hypothetical protein